jgi:DNA-binding NarL/FixJ family response regulator
VTVRVLVVDDHPVVRTGLRHLLGAADGIVVVGEYGDADAAVAEAGVTRPDVVLMDLRMPGRDGVAATAAVRAAVPTAVLVLTTFDDDADVVRAIAAGASGYLLKDVPAATLVAAVRAVARGETVLGPGAAAALAGLVRGPVLPALTAREHDVLTGAADGLSNRQIAARLRIGEATVKSHLVRVFEKLQVNGRTAAVTAAIARGILPAPRP